MATRILCVTSGLAGMLYSSVELARRLAADGHHLIVASFASARDLIEHHGFEYLELEPSRYEEFLEQDGDTNPVNRLVRLRHRRRRAAEAIGLGSFLSSAEEIRPDLMLIDGEMHEHIITASKTGARIALLNTFCSIWRRPGLPPPHHLARPGVGWKGSRFGIWFLWKALRLRKLGKAWRLKLRRVGCDRQSILRVLAEDASFDLSRETDASQWLIPFTYRNLPVLSVHAREFDFPHQPLSTVHYVGPMVLESRADAPMEPGERQRLDELFQRHQSSNGREKLIYAGFGSAFSTDVDFLRRLAEATSERPDWNLVISLSNRTDPTILGPLPERVCAFRWLPQTEVLQHADIAVTHGGINTIDECVVAGVPLLVYCGFETDMAGNTARIEHHGIGIAGDRHRDGASVIRGHIDRVLRDSSFKDNIQRLQCAYQVYAEDRVAERVVESLIGGTTI
jgi:UDP:flavonoid glycosyltransferase YjiC (YdhE family)